MVAEGSAYTCGLGCGKTLMGGPPARHDRVGECHAANIDLATRYFDRHLPGQARLRRVVRNPPPDRARVKPQRPIFVVQKHQAHRAGLHWDFRLEAQ